MRVLFSVLVVILCTGNLFGQVSNWKKDTTQIYNNDDSTVIWRYGGVAISHAFNSPYNSKLMVTDKYRTINNRGIYVSVNEPLGVNDTTTVGLATDTQEAHNVFVANHYANFKPNTNFTDVHTSTAEFNFFRGISDSVGFRDGGTLAKTAVVKLSGTFGNSGRTYRNTEFDMLNLRFFTDQSAGNPAIIDNFYGIRFEDFRGVNTSMITKGWGIFIKPTILNNFFGGKVGIGTQDVTHALTIDAVSNPLKVKGLATSSSPSSIMVVNAAGEVSKSNLADQVRSFQVTVADATLIDTIEIYIHKGGNANYTLPAPGTRTGKTWSISNVGSGSITLNVPFFDGNETRNTIINKAGANKFVLFSDGTDYISIK